MKTALTVAVVVAVLGVLAYVMLHKPGLPGQRPPEAPPKNPLDSYVATGNSIATLAERVKASFFDGKKSMS